MRGGLPVNSADVYRVELQVSTKAVGLSERSDELVLDLDGTRLIRRRLSHESDAPHQALL